MKVENIKSSFQMICATIVNLELDNSIICHDDIMEEEEEVDVSYEIINIFEHEVEDVKVGVMDLVLEITSTDNSEEKSGFRMALVYRGAFSVSKNMSDDDFSHMLSVNGCASLYSMARAAVNVISTQMFARGNIVLPMVNFIEFNKIVSKE